MRPPSEMPQRRRRPRAPGRGRVVLIIVAVVAFVLVTFLRQIAEFWTDYLWFDSVGFAKVWTKTLAIKVELATVFTLVFFVALWLNLFIADRVSPKFRPLGPDEELLNRYHQMIDRRAGALRFVVALVFAFITGAGMSSQWNQWVLFNNGGDFATTDPQFGNNVGFYVFRLPFLTSVVDWLFASLVIVLLITAVAHYLNGGIRLQSPFERVTPQVKAHLSVLLALLALVKAGDYWLQQYQVLFSDRGTVNGATYTEVHAQLPATYLLLFVALASFVLFLVNIRRRGWVLPVVAVGLWALVAVVIGEAYPAIYQQVIVKPEESTKEATAIQNNIEATRTAYGLDKIEVKPFAYSSSVDVATKAVNDNPDVVRNVQLLDPKRVRDTFQKAQSQVSPLQFAQVATDRYPMKLPNGSIATTQVVVANRDMNVNILPSTSWENVHLNYTHGYGLALAAGGAVSGGAPDYAVRDIPVSTPNSATPSIDLQTDQPNNYFMDTDNPQTAQLYSVVNTDAPEFDYVRNSGDPSAEYRGTGGVPLDSLGRRLAFFVKYSDPYILISQYITDQSRILYLRDVRQRAQTAAPFLTFDTDPYPAVVDHHTVYVIDAYTTSDQYPNSEFHDPAGIGSVNDLRNQSFNYVRNSVKAVVDTFDGSIKLYVMDKNDPVIAAYQQAFPELFKDRSEISSDLRAHLRYPEDIFRVQTDLYGRYHLLDPTNFYKYDKAWEPPAAPAVTVQSSSTAANAAAAVAQANPQLQQIVPVQTTDRIAPYYVMNKFEGDTEPGFMLMRSYQPFSTDGSKNLLTAFIVARSDGDDLGRLQVYETKESDQIEGPTIVSTKMLSDAAVSGIITQLNQQGSTVYFSDLLLVPIDKSVMYVRSLYVVSNGDKQANPLVRWVIVYYGGRVVVKTSYKEAVRTLLPNSNPQTFETNTDSGANPNNPVGTTPTTTTAPTTPGTTPDGSTIPPTTTGPTAAELINQAEQLLADAQKAYDDHDLGTYQKKVNEATDKIKQAQQQLGTATPDPASTTTVAGTTGSTPPVTDAPTTAAIP